MNKCHPYLEDIEAIKGHLESWKDLAPDQMKFERLGGLSNRIWKVSSPGSSIFPEAVIFRKFNQSAVVDRVKENHILRELAKTGVGSKFYAGTDEYRLEKYYDSTELNPAELNTLPTRRHLAKSLAELHGVELNGLDKVPTFKKVLDDKAIIKLAEDKARKSELYTQEEKVLLEEIMGLASKEEIAFLNSVLPKNAESVVFSHNDLHSANVLALVKNQRLLLIDYEYSDYNYRGYDIANVFNESLFKYGYNQPPYYEVEEARFPSDEDLEDFITYYLFFFKFHVDYAEGETLIGDKNQLMDYIEKHCGVEDFNHEVQQIKEEVRACSLFSHYYWAFWSVVMSKRADIKFDYISYAYKRVELYRRVKAKFFGRTQNVKKVAPVITHAQSS